MGRSSMNFIAFGLGVGWTSVTRNAIRPDPAARLYQLPRLTPRSSLKNFRCRRVARVLLDFRRATTVSRAYDSEHPTDAEKVVHLTTSFRRHPRVDPTRASA